MAGLLSNVRIKFGLVGFAAYFALMLVGYFAGVPVFLSFGYKLFMWVLMLAIAFMAGAVKLRSNGGHIRFEQAMGVVLSIFVFSEIGAALAEWLVFNVINPDFHLAVKDYQIAKTKEQMGEMSKMIQYAEGDFEENMEEVSRRHYNFSLANAVQKFVTFLAVDFVFALILAAIIKKEPRATE
ncbi:DUF4199 family protein [bacterium]|nr:DUF4199 family protein [bacterium]